MASHDCLRLTRGIVENGEQMETHFQAAIDETYRLLNNVEGQREELLNEELENDRQAGLNEVGAIREKVEEFAEKVFQDLDEELEEFLATTKDDFFDLRDEVDVKHRELTSSIEDDLGALLPDTRSIGLRQDLLENRPCPSAGSAEVVICERSAELENLRDEFHELREKIDGQLKRRQRDFRETREEFRRRRRQWLKQVKQRSREFQRRIRQRFEEIQRRRGDVGEEGPVEDDGSDRAGVAIRLVDDDQRQIVEDDGVRKLKLRFQLDCNPQQMTFQMVERNILQIILPSAGDLAADGHIFGVRYRLPDGVDVTQLSVTVSEEGHLEVVAPATSADLEGRTEPVTSGEHPGTSSSKAADNAQQ